jgi:hypothetical protein
MLTRILLPAGLLAGLAAAVCAAEEKPPARPEHAELARLILAAVVAKLPREFEDRSGWGRTIPDPGNLRLPQLRTRVKVGDKEELAHGAWVRTRGWLDDPAKDVQVEVRDLRKVDPKTVQLRLAVTVSGHGERERRQYEKGLRLFDLTLQADAVVVLVLDCDVGLALNTSTFPPEVVVEPKVTKSQLELKEFEPRKVGKVQLGERARELAGELKGVLQDHLKKHEQEIKDRINAAIARGLKEGKGSVSAGALLKAEPSKKE